MATERIAPKERDEMVLVVFFLPPFSRRSFPAPCPIPLCLCALLCQCSARFVSVLYYISITFPLGEVPIHSHSQLGSSIAMRLLLLRVFHFICEWVCAQLEVCAPERPHRQQQQKNGSLVNPYRRFALRTVFCAIWIAFE